MMIDALMWSVMMALGGATGAMIWSYAMARFVAAPRAKKMIVESLTTEGPELVAVREHLIQPALDAQKGVFPEITVPSAEDIASAVEQAVNANLGPQISTHVNMALKQMEAQQSKRVGQFLKDTGLDEQLEALEDGVKAEALAQAGPMAQFVAEVMAAKIPKNATTAEKAWLTISKAAAAQMAQSGMANILPGQAASQTATGYAPGLR